MLSYPTLESLRKSSQDADDGIRSNREITAMKSSRKECNKASRLAIEAPPRHGLLGPPEANPSFVKFQPPGTVIPAISAQRKKDMEEKNCFIRHKDEHLARDCPDKNDVIQRPLPEPRPT